MSEGWEGEFSLLERRAYARPGIAALLEHRLKAITLAVMLPLIFSIVTKWAGRKEEQEPCSL